MSNKREHIRLNGTQLQFIMKALDMENGREAMEKFAELMFLEHIDPSLMPECIDKMMAKQKLLK